VSQVTKSVLVHSLTFFSKSFPTISDQDKCEILDNLSRLPCAFGGSLTTTVQDDLLRKQLCHMCDEERQDSELFKGQTQTDESDELCQILASVVPKISRSSNIRVITMATLKRILMHTSSSMHLQLSNSIFGDFLLNSLRSSLRELRVLAGQVLQTRNSSKYFRC
jgi:serine/threonine-protein kinase ATR